MSGRDSRLTPSRLLAAMVLLIFAPSLSSPAAAEKTAESERRTLDCSADPCAALLTGASAFRPSERGGHWEGLDSRGEIVGWLALSTDFVDVKAYSGKPMLTLVGLDTEGLITGARVLEHSEPILLVGIPEKALTDFVEFYKAKPALSRFVVGRTLEDDAFSVDAISGATVTALSQNITIVETARALGAEVGVFSVAEVRSGQFIHEEIPWTFAQMLENELLQRLTVSEKAMGISESQEAYVDLYFGIADPSHIGRAVLGERSYDHHVGKLAEGEYLLVVFNTAPGSFKGSAFVRGGIFDRIRVLQGLREITFRDTDYDNLPDIAADDAPEISEGALFVLRGGRFDPGEPYDLVFLGSRYDMRGAFSREFRQFSATQQLPDSVYHVEANSDEEPWRQAWKSRTQDILLLTTFLSLVVLVFAFRRHSMSNPDRAKRLHVASLFVALGLVGLYLRAPVSVTQIFTLQESALGEWRWSLFLSDPLIFILWLFITGVSLVWGRGVFCGWVCPYGSFNRLCYSLGRRLGLPLFRVPPRVHRPLTRLRYVILISLCMLYLWDSILAERMAEIEPFKSTFLISAWTRSPAFIAWWLVLFAASFFVYRPFCRYICPLGGGLTILGSHRISPPRRRAFCESCKVCSRDCLPGAIRPDGTINTLECLSCMNCEATYHSRDLCPPLIGLDQLAKKSSLTANEKAKRARLLLEARDI